MYTVRSAVLALVLILAGGAPARSAPELPIEQAFEELRLLQGLNQLELTRAQLEELRKAWRELDAERRKLIGNRDTPEIRAALAAIRKGLLENRPKEDLGPLYEKLESLLPPKETEGEPEKILYDRARPLAAAVAGLLRANQIVRIVGEKEDGPAQQILQTIRKTRGASPGKEGSLSEFGLHFSRRLTLDVARSAKARQELEALLGRALKLTNAEFKAQAEGLEDEAEQIVNRAVGSPLGVLQWQAEQRLSGLLMHPRLGPILDERLNVEPKR